MQCGIGCVYNGREPCELAIGEGQSQQCWQNSNDLLGHVLRKTIVGHSLENTQENKGH